MIACFPTRLVHERGEVARMCLVGPLKGGCAALLDIPQQSGLNVIARFLSRPFRANLENRSSTSSVFASGMQIFGGSRPRVRCGHHTFSSEAHPSLQPLPYQEGRVKNNQTQT
jgi:hypothetical protein